MIGLSINDPGETGSVAASVVRPVRPQTLPAWIQRATTDRWNITYLLDAAAAQLRAMRIKITKDLLVDQARADVTNVAAFRVYGLLVPQVHMLIAAYELRQLLSDYTAEEHSLEQQINSTVLGANVGGARVVKRSRTRLSGPPTNPPRP